MKSMGLLCLMNRLTNLGFKGKTKYIVLEFGWTYCTLEGCSFFPFLHLFLVWSVSGCFIPGDLVYEHTHLNGNFWSIEIHSPHVLCFK
jgi:hypothetical protein